jgi:hypothetical protein
MHDVVDDLVAAIRRHETALTALRTPGHRASSPEELARIERKLECCEQWLKLLRVDEDLARRRAARAQAPIPSNFPPPAPRRDGPVRKVS